MCVNKVIRKGKVAVLVSPGFGAGWSTWIGDDDDSLESVFDPVVVKAVEDGILHEDILLYLKEKYENGYFGGYYQLVIEWVPVGQKFRIEDYDGSESLIFEEDLDWITA